MTFVGYIVAVLGLASVCVYALDGCLKGFRRTRSSSRIKASFYLLGAALTFGVISLLLLAAFLLFVGPLH